MEDAPTSSPPEPQLLGAYWLDSPVLRHGYLPLVRLHDLRHLAAALALAAGAEMKVASAMLRHSTIQITADTYASVLPEIARQAAEAAAALVPQPPTVQPDDGGVSPSLASDPENDQGHPSDEKDAQVTDCAPPGTRTPDPLIKSQLL